MPSVAAEAGVPPTHRGLSVLVVEVATQHLGQAAAAGGQADNIISDEKQGETEILAFGSGGPGIESGFNGARVCGAGSNTTCKGAI